MQLKMLASLSAILILSSGCSLLTPKPLPPREVKIITKPVPIDIVHPTMPRSLNLKEPKWYVVSDAKIIEECKKDPVTKERDCKLGKEDLYPEGYTYFDRFVADIKKKHGGDLVFVAMSVADYELMSYNTQEIKRYITQLGDVVIYYKEVTTTVKEPEDGVQ